MEPTIVDDYSHLNPEIYYVPENIPCSIWKEDSNTYTINAEYNSQIASCFCTNNCNLECTCILKEYKNSQEHINKKNIKIRPYKFDDIHSEMILSDDFLKLNIPFYECNSQCTCENSCQNRLVQFGPRKNLIIRNSQQYKSSGLFTLSNIPRGAFICEYAGEIITKLEAIKRNKLNSLHGLMNYIICVNENIGSDKIQTFVDPSKFGNIGRYLNHSCDPNCAIFPIRVDSPIPKLCLFSIKTIICESELTFDYGILSNKYFSQQDKVTCLCKSENCMKWLPFSEYD